ncbi:hypothetical protein JOE11_005346 [Robbsia andropogonis]|uniref:hypothetical protein n=1 Tax=Robbsia andropogonis TaxID=28092 RepID=UPI003D1AA194
MSDNHSQDNIELLSLADARSNRTRQLLHGFVLYHLPERIRKHFGGEEGEKVFLHAVVYGNNVWPDELAEKYASVVRRAQIFLIAIPRYRVLLEAVFYATMDWCEARELVDKDEELFIEEF